MLRSAEFTSYVGTKRVELIEEAVPHAARGAFGSANFWDSAFGWPATDAAVAADEVIQ